MEYLKSAIFVLYSKMAANVNTDEQSVNYTVEAASLESMFVLHMLFGQLILLGKCHRPTGYMSIYIFFV